MSHLLAAIDIGSNAARLLISQASRNNEHVDLQKQNLVRVPLRLGKDVYQSGKISRERSKMFLDTMQAYMHLLNIYKPEAYAVCATAAMREAENGIALLKQVRKYTGMEVKLIDGLEEARLIRNTGKIQTRDGYDFTMFVDVGGGSTEISVLTSVGLVAEESFPIGTLRKASGRGYEQSKQRMTTWLKQFHDHYGKIHLIGSGGNINKLVKLYGDIKNRVIACDELDTAIQQMEAMNVKERMLRYNLREDRADVIVPAARIFKGIMQQIESGFTEAPKIGVADGLITDLFLSMEKKS